MKLFSIEEAKILIEQPKGICVSIYMPTHKLGTQTQQDPVRFKNLIKEAEDKLIEVGMRPQDARDMLVRAQELDDYQFWQHQSDGLAIFIADNFFSYYQVPLNFDELVVVTDRFHLKPLLQLLTNDGRFYLLALSQNQIRLFQGTRYSISKIELEDVPQSIAEALRYDDPEKQLQFHTGTSQGGGVRAAVFHGQGAGEDDQKENILRYFRKVDSGIQELLKNQQFPLVLAGVEYLFPIYKEANNYPYLIDGGVTGNPDISKPEELHAQAWEMVQPHFEKNQQELVERYQELVGTGQTSDNISEVVSAAYFQRVDSLFVGIGVQKWGSFDSENNQVEVHDEQQTGDEDLMDLAAIHTLINSGTVYAVEPEFVPGNSPIAGIFRY
ncbi:hypothetical protein IQ230_01720 [Gloeocapsopsis crepidinum LEGE 06123]|uniref:Uncharacterized protein n=1 Tax=Gloeocapsopsis crepidinum LEGE 06123 TaxID=588587 RepID=A0ABR9UM47_9CHRO|nr:hypothetical protein [Gloeocapsopsis crepidinum]MBE9189103.1 hypothetical protein [Gloeocapsopsis crepidinum LEGE 06123]